MAKLVNIIFVISCIIKKGPNAGKIHSIERPSLEEAYMHFENAKKEEYKCLLESVVDGVRVVLEAYNWDFDCFQLRDEQNWKLTAVGLLLKAKINKPTVETIIKMDVGELRNAVATNNIDKLTVLNGVGEKTAIKVVRALRKICKASTVKTWKSMEFLRAQLNNDQTSDDVWVYDTIRKTVSPFEEKMMELGGKDAVIHVVSRIEEPSNPEDLGGMIRAQKLLDAWLDVIQNGLVINGIRYRIFGHGTNAAKWCKTMAVKESIYDQARVYVDGGCEADWQNTAAKDIAYKVGLLSVYSHVIDIPFRPEMFCIYPTVEKIVKANTTKLFLDGHAFDKDDDDVPVKYSDGVFFISMTKKVQMELHNQLVYAGRTSEEADKLIENFVEDTSFYSYRGNPAKFKGLGGKNVKVQDYLHSIGVKTTPDGRDIDDIVFFVDESVLKTTIGKGKAYKTFEDWCQAMGEKIYLGTVVKTHPKAKKNVSYQVTQCLCEATDEQIEKMASKTINRLNNSHTVKNATKMLGREWGAVAEKNPSLVNVRSFRDHIEHKMDKDINEAFSGKILKASYYAFVCPDQFVILAAWHGKNDEGMLKAGQIHIPTIPYGKLAMWRSPVVHPNSVRVMENVPIPNEYKKFIRNDEFAIILNCHDDTAVAMDMDFDGDHANVTDETSIIEAAEETLKIWNRLIIWETPKPEKMSINEEVLRSYFAGLVHMNELGLTVYGLNALLNGLLRYKDEIDGRWYIKRVNVTRRGVDFKKFAANVLVDASKHGGAEIEEPEESAQSASMLQPWAKIYKDAVDNGELWYVKLNGKAKFFPNEQEAKLFYNNTRYYVSTDEYGNVDLDENGNSVMIDRFNLDENNSMYLDSNLLQHPVNHLDELADPAKLNELHRYKTLNKLFALYAKHARRDKEIDDAPADKFDYKKIMFTPETGFRKMAGLIREGKGELVTINGEKIRPGQGLFNSLARRLDRDRAAWYDDDANKDKSTVNDDEEDATFEMAWRANALVEIEAFARACNRTLEDAYDVITWQMFEYCDSTYMKMDGKTDFICNKMWAAYRLIFGGMAVEAANAYEEEVALATSEEELNID